VHFAMYAKATASTGKHCVRRCSRRIVCTSRRTDSRLEPPNQRSAIRKKIKKDVRVDERAITSESMGEVVRDPAKLFARRQVSWCAERTAR